MDRLAEVMSSRKSTDTVLTCGKDIYLQISASIPAGVLQYGGRITHHGLAVVYDESKEDGYVEIS